MILAKQATLTGFRLIAGVWYFKYLYNIDTIKPKVIELWNKNSKFFEFEKGYLLTFDSPILMNCDKISGSPLERNSSGLFNAELINSTSDFLSDITLLHENSLIKLYFHQGQTINVSTWIDVSDYRFLEPDLAINEDRFEDTSPISSPTDTRTIFNKVLGNPGEERNKFLSDIGNAQTKNATNIPAGLSGLNILKFIGSLFKSNSTDSVSKDGQTSSNFIEPRKPLNTKIQRWRNWVTQMALLTKASKLIGASHANYLKKLMDKFESGDLQEALRHAIPLGDGTQSLGQALGRLQPRNNLTISRYTAAASSVSFGDQIEAHLRKLYRQAFERLDRMGKHEEAAFVLADLLRNKQEALDYLLNHDRLSLATELALSWDMPADTIIRLLCLAGEFEKAVLIAKRDNAFAAAIATLQNKPDIAKKLRYLWADYLISQGNWLDAVEAIWPIQTEQSLAIEWLKKAESSYGELGVRATIQLLIKSPEDSQRCAKSLLTLIENPSNADYRNNIAANILNVNVRHQLLSLLIAKLIPWIWIDSANRQSTLSNKQLDKLLMLCSDALLKMDIPSTKNKISETLLHITLASNLLITAPSIGQQSIEDIVMLSNNRMLIALGEPGLIIVNENMQRCMQYAIPCNRIVLSESRQVVLLIQTLDERSKVTRLDLVTHEKLDLGILDIDLFAPEFDGVKWVITSRDRYLVIDTSTKELQTLWSLSDLQGKIIRISSNTNHESLMINKEDNVEIWTYSLPSRRLYKKDLIPIDSFQKGFINLSASGQLLNIELLNHENRWTVQYKLWNKVLTLDLPINSEPIGFRAESDDRFFILQILLEDKQLCLGVNTQTASIIFNLDWPMDSQVNVRLNRTHIIFSDSLGRIVTIEQPTSRVFTGTLR